MGSPVLCFDVDGTLVNAAGEIHPRDRELLAGREGVLFIPATGRPLHALRRAFRRNQLFADQPLPLPLILQNGAVLYRPGEELLSVRPVAPSIQQAVLDVAGRFPQVSALLFSHDGVHIWHPNPFSRRLIDRFDLEAQPYLAGTTAVPFTKFIFLSEDEETLAEIKQTVAHLPLEISHSLATVMELNERGVQKQQGLLALLAAMGVEPGPVLAAGDGENDLPLLRAADHSFCPTDALPAVQAACAHVVDVEREGILSAMLAQLPDR